MARGSAWNSNKPVRQQELWEEHAAFMDAMFEAGVIILAGPFADESGSMIIMYSESAEAARSVFLGDPWSQHNILAPRDVKEWTIFLDSRATVAT